MKALVPPLLIWPLLLAAFISSSCCNIKQEWRGDPEPTLGKAPLQNGDFTIYGLGTLGDGIKDNTHWLLDLSHSPLVTEPRTPWEITSLKLTMDFTANGSTYKDCLHFNDNRLTWSAFKSLYCPKGGSWSVKKFELELLDKFTSEQLLREIRRNGGKVEIHLKDDILISRATLCLNYERLEQ